MIDIEELKKLPTHVKVELIDELLHSMDDSSENESGEDNDLDDEVLQEIERRSTAMHTGEMETYSWEEAKIILQDALNKRNSPDGSL